MPILSKAYNQAYWLAVQAENPSLETLPDTIRRAFSIASNISNRLPDIGEKMSREEEKPEQKNIEETKPKEGKPETKEKENTSKKGEKSEPKKEEKSESKN